MLTKFREFVLFFKEHRKDSLIAILIIGVIGLGYTTFEYRGEIMKQLTHTTINSQEFSELLKINNNIQVSLDTLRGKTGATRVVIRRFHNGKYDLTGVPFEEISDTYASMDKDYVSTIDADEYLTLQAIHSTLGLIWRDYKNPTCLVVTAASTNDYQLKRYLLANEITFSYICPITNITDYPLGILIVNITYEPTAVQSEEIKKLAEKSAGKVAGYLESKNLLRANKSA